jgi:threonine/homoserine/homoserine lactone efflux protein
VPGPAVAFVVARSIAQGRSAGVVSVLGIHAGSVVHVAAAVLGLSALLASSALAFTVVKYGGAAYLIYLGIRQWRRGGREGEPPEPAAEPRWRLFRQGITVNVLNPKTAIFFLAFLPQFADPARGPVWLQALVLGLIFIGLGVLTDGAYAVGAGAIGARFRRSARVQRLTARITGGVYVTLGAIAAAIRNPAVP